MTVQKGSAEHHPNVLYDDDELEDAEQCGCEIRCCGGCRTKRFVLRCLSCCNTPKFVLVFLSIVAFFQGFIVNGLINVGISTLERRFHLQSYESGLIASSYDIGSVCCLLFVTYIGGKGHKPIWLGWGVFIMGCGSIFISLPHFIAPSYHPNGGTSDLCYSDNDQTCGDSILRPYRGFFIVGQLLNGIGASPFYTLGVTYMDENVKQVYSSTYHGIYYAFSILGPGVGYLLGGQFLSFYTNLGESPELSSGVVLTESSQLWVGAWWLGFFAAGLITVVVSLPVQLFPYQFPNTEKVRKNREKEMYKDKIAEDVRKDEEFGARLKDVPKSFLVIIRNPTLVCLSIAGAMESSLIAGISTFGPKFYQSVFSITSSEAATVFGGLALAGGVVGMLGGAVVITKFKMTLEQMLKMSIISAFIALLALFIFLYTCPNLAFAGGTVPYNSESAIGEILSECNAKCGCSLDLYEPVCGSDNLTYFSPCYAGCSQYNDTTKTYSNCSCVADANFTISLSDAQAKNEICTITECPNYILFIVIMFVSVTFTFFNSIPALQSTIRSVPFNQRSFAVGVQWVFLRCLGSIPGPLIYGSVLDLTCVVWNEECGVRGSCKRYDNTYMSRYLLALNLCYKTMALIMFTLAWYLYKPRVKSAAGSNTTESTDDTIDMANGNRTEPKANGHDNLGYNTEVKEEGRTEL